MPAQFDEVSTFAFPLKPREYAPAPLPSLEEWRKLWAAWDLVTTKMIPAAALMEKPIPLRNPLMFYLGHIPTFEDIHLTRATKSDATEPAIYHKFFERGIDPDVDDPTKCHDHSELPQEWPALQDILAYRERVKKRITSLYNTPKVMEDRSISRAIWIGFEHEGLHLETFLYMTLQSPNVLPPPGSKPNFHALAQKAYSERIENQWFKIPTQTLTIGFDDPENDDGPERFFAWDNEREPYTVQVSGIKCQARPVCNKEYAAFILATGKMTIPITWTNNLAPSIRQCSLPERTNSDQLTGSSDSLERFIDSHAVKTVYGPVPLALALDWPLMASYNEVQSYAEWAKARIPTLLEVRSIHEYVEKEKQKNDHNHRSGIRPNPDPEEIFIDLTGCNTGLQHFHPVAVTQNGNRVSGLGDMGGAWEWTSTSFSPQPKFKPMDIYPGYSADFMDGKHNVVVGGSWATHPRITGRKSFLNWWQLNYLYPWATIRLVRNEDS